jgi:hypothetical protein
MGLERWMQVAGPQPQLQPAPPLVELDLRIGLEPQERDAAASGCSAEKSEGTKAEALAKLSKASCLAWASGHSSTFFHSGDGSGQTTS